MPRIAIAVLWILVLSANPLRAETQGSEAIQLAKAVFSAAGLGELLDHIAEEAVLGVQPGGPGFPEATLRALRQSAAAAYDAGQLRRFVLERLEKGLDARTSQRVLEWWRSEMGKRIAEMDRAGLGADTDTEREAFAEELEQRPPSRERIALVARLDTATLATKTDLDVALYTGFGTLVIGTPLGVAEEPGGWQALEEKLLGQRLSLEPLFREAVQENLLFLYRQMEDGELEQYVRFAESEVGRRYYETAGNALRDALIRAGLDLASRLPQMRSGAAPLNTPI